MLKFLGKHNFGAAVMFFMTAAPSFFSCADDQLATVDAIDRKKVPGQYVRNISTLISDSGVVKYRIFAEEWYVYDKADTPYYDFPEGLFLENFDSLMNVTSSIKCKNAQYFIDDELWDLKDSVHAMNTQGEHFETNRLFWNQKTESVYSKERIKITQKNRVIVGKEFESNQSFTEYVIKNPEGVFPIED